MSNVNTLADTLEEIGKEHRMTMHHWSIIVDAIITRTPLAIDYYPGWRRVEPFVAGYGKRGQVLIRGYQTGGKSRSGSHAGWKTFRLDRIRSVEIPASWAPETFDADRAGFHLGSQFARIIAQVGK